MGTGAPQGGMSPQQQAQQMLPPGGIMGALPQGSILGRPGMGQPGMGMGRMIPRPQGGAGLASFLMQHRGGR